MNVLSLIQPWATLVVIGEKGIETRSWKPKTFTGELYIHASKKINKDICLQEPFKSILARHNYTINNLPIGMIIGKCNVLKYSKTEDLRCSISEQEKAFGDYSDNRYGWILEKCEILNHPIIAKGKLNIWKYEIQ